MIEIFLLMLAGAIGGWLMRRMGFSAKVFTHMTPTICILLFLMGLTVGSDPEIITNLSSLGLEGAILAVAGVLGSAIAAWFVAKWLDNKKPKE